MIVQVSVLDKTDWTPGTPPLDPERVYVCLILAGESGVGVDHFTLCSWGLRLTGEEYFHEDYR